MTKKILLTSFDTWQPHQPSNSSDDLLLAVSQQHLSQTLFFLRKLPVNFQLAPQQVMASIDRLQPDGLICCGMAEQRQRLSIESSGKRGENAIATPIDLSQLIAELQRVEISHDAGNFVCNHLYYEMLRYWRDRNPLYPCLFIHVPPLTPDNFEPILDDFLLIVHRLAQQPN